MAVSRRQFISSAAATAAGWPLLVHAQRNQSLSDRLFQHGVASGDPLHDRVMLWTRVTPPATRSAAGPADVRWVIAQDESLSRVVGGGTASAAPERDFTVKVDAGGLASGRTYFYAFDAAGQRSPIGRTKTLPSRGVDRLRLATVSCANYPAGFFNVYRCVANRADLDAVVHLGDYIYEFANGVFGDGSGSGRVPLMSGEATSLLEYRSRYATYRSDIDLQEVHRLHPFIAVWDDHELANDAWSGGAANHDAREGDWATRRAAAYQAYLEWLPVRESTRSDIHLYRAFRFGDLADLVMLDTRGLRDRQAPAGSMAELADPRRSLLGAEQEAWLFSQLRDSKRVGTPWRLLGQQVLFSVMSPPGVPVVNRDMWDGYPAARQRVTDFLIGEKIPDLAIFTGDLHSSWAVDVARDPWTEYNPTTGAGSLGVELVTPAVSSPPLFSNPTYRERAPLLQLAARHLKYLDGERRGYVIVDITREQLHATWQVVPTVTTRGDDESTAAEFVCERGSSHLVPA